MKQERQQNELTSEQLKLIEENDNLVHYILRKDFKYMIGQAEYEDLAQEGRIGLIKAAKKFDATLGYEFSTYATSVIRGGFQRYNRDVITGNGLKISRSTLNLKYKINKLRESNPDITKLEISEELSISLAEVDRAGVRVVELEAPIGDGDLTIKDTLADTNNQYEDIIAEEALESVIKTIKEKYDGYKVDLLEEFIWSIVYLGERLTQNKLAHKYKISQVTVSRILTEFKGELAEELNYT